MKKPITINRFDGGIVSDPRDPRENTCRMVTNFDVITNPYKMTPYRDSESGDSAASTRQLQNFQVALRTGTTYQLYGLGVTSGTSRAEIFYKDLATGASTSDLDDAGWTSPTNGASASGTTDFTLFKYYQKTGKIYGTKGIGGTSSIWGFDATDATTFKEDIINTETSAAQSSPTGITTIAQAIVHSKQDILYIPYNNKIASNNNTSWNQTALTLPSQYYITSICEYGNLVAIAAVPSSKFGNSKVFLWNPIISDVQEIVDWGEGALQILEEVNGELIGISQTGQTTATLDVTFDDRIFFKRYVPGYGAEKIGEYKSAATIPLHKQKERGRLWFQMSITIAGSTREGLWSFGRTSNGYSLAHEATPNNDTALTSGVMKGFVVVGDYFFQSYTSGGTFGLSKTNDTASNTATSIYESKIFNGGDSNQKKKLIGVAVSTEYLPAAGQVVLKYKRDAETSWVTISTTTTDNNISREDINIVSTGKNLGDFYETQFRIESTGGAEITGLKFLYDEYKTLLSLK